MERSFRNLVVECRQQLLATRIPPTQGEELHPASSQIHLHANQSVEPKLRHAVSVAQDRNLTGGCATPQIDHQAIQSCPRVKSPAGGETTAVRSGLDTTRRALPRRPDVGLRSSLQATQACVLETTPHLGLPAAVVVLDHGLETRLPGRSKDRDDPQAQTQPGHSTETIRPVMGSVKDRVVVELGIARQSHLPPVLQEPFYSDFRGDDRVRPRLAQPSMKADGVEHLDVDSTPNDQTFDDVETVQLGLARGHARQIPTLGRGGSPHTLAAIESSPSLQDATDGAKAWDLRTPISHQGPLDRGRTVFAERAVISQVSAQLKNAIFHRLGSPIRRARTTPRAIRKVDITQTLMARAVQPSLNRTETYPKPGGYLPEGLSFSDCHDHHASPALRVCFCLMSLFSGGFLHHCNDLRFLTL